MRRRSIGDTSPAPIAVLRHWTAMACLVACALQRVALTREVAADSTTAQADYEYFRGDFFPELMNPSPGIESDDNDRRHHEYRCTDCADDQEPDAYERRAHEHRCAECAEEPGQDGQERRAHEHHRCADCDPTEPRSLQSTAAYEIDGGGGDGHRNRHDDTPRNSPRPPPTVFVNKKRDHRYRVVVPPIYRRRHGVINSSDRSEYPHLKVTVIAKSTSIESPLNRMFNINWNQVIKRTTNISPQRSTRNMLVDLDIL